MKPKRRVAAVELAAAHAKADAYQEALGVARTFESKGADAGTVRLALQFLARDAKDEADLCVPLDEPEAHPPSSGSSSADSGSWEGVSPRSFTPQEDAYLEGVARGMDMAFRVVFAPEPQSLRVDLDDRPHLRVVE